jgi:hypothetical protein
LLIINGNSSLQAPEKVQSGHDAKFRLNVSWLSLVWLGQEQNQAQILEQTENISEFRLKREPIFPGTRVSAVVFYHPLL